MTLLDQIESAHRRRLNPSGGCHNCPRKHVDFVPATLRKGSVLWLGEAPGATEVKDQEGFTGKAGQYLRRHAEDAGVPGPWSFSNSIHCRPPDNRTPNAKEIQCCLRQFVLDEVADYSVVVLVGAVPLQALFPGAKATHFRGNFAHHPDFPGQRFYAIYHSAYMLRRRDLEPHFVRQLQRLGRVVRGEDPPPKWSIVRGSDGLAALRKAVQSPLLSLDLETNTVESWSPEARMKSMTATADGLTVAAFHESDPHWDVAKGLVHEYLQDPGKGVVGSQVAFDVEWMEREGGYRARVTLHEVSLIWYEAERYKQVSLKQLVPEQLDGYRYLVHEPNRCEDVDLLLKYGAEDVVHPLELFHKGMARLQPRQRDLVVRVLCPMALPYQRARAHGIYIHEGHRQSLLQEYEDKRKAVVLAWKAADPQFVPKAHESGKGLANYLFKLKGLPVFESNKDGSPSVDKAIIKQWIRDGATYLEHLLELREIDKLVSTFIKPYGKCMDGASRIHSSHWLNSTDTTRPSSTDPNVYNVARKDDIRNQHGVPQGAVLVESDLSQIEFRIMVCLAGDENGIAGYRRGDDAHTMTARTIARVEQPTKEQRSLAKPVNFSLIYGGGAEGVRRMARDDYKMDWSPEQAQVFTDGFFSTYPRIPEFHEQRREQLVRNRGWFESVTGHVFHYEDWDHPNEARREHTFRSAINSEAQGPAVNICYLIASQAQRLMYERGMVDVVMVNSVYDSIMNEVPDPARVPDVIACIEEASRLAYEWVKGWFVVPLVIEHATGEAWGSLEPWEE